MSAVEVERALTEPEHADLVDLVARPLGESHYRVAAVDGSVEFRWADDRAEIVEVDGRDPLARTDPTVFAAAEDEQSGGPPSRQENSYPDAHAQLVQFFDAASAPDLIVQHTAAHHFSTHIGEHGSLGVVQARAPFLAAGPGLRSVGWQPGHARTVDIAPTVLQLLGAERAADGTYLRRQDGEPVDPILDGETARRVAVFLLDGTNANALSAAIDAGDAPTMAGLVERGTGLESGLLASYPTATLANHTTLGTGVHPGHSGVLHNEWYDRAGATQPDLLHPGQMFTAMQHLAPGIETTHEAVQRSFPDAFTAATYEFCDRGADYSSFALLAAGTPAYFPSGRSEIPHMSVDMAEASAPYKWMSRVDHASRTAAIERWRDEEHPLPTYCFVSFSLTDEASHTGGPHSEMARRAIIDSDARLADVLGAIDDADALEETAVLVIADHGMEENDPAVTGEWSAAFDHVDDTVRDVGGFLYLD